MEKQKDMNRGLIKKHFNLVALLGLLHSGFYALWQTIKSGDRVAGLVSVILFIFMFSLAVFYIIKYIKEAKKDRVFIQEKPSVFDVELVDIFKKKGIVSVLDEKKGDHRKVNEKVSHAEDSVEIIAYYADMLLGGISVHLLNSINKKGITVKVLIAKKEGSELLADVATLEVGAIPVADIPDIIDKIKQRITFAKNGKKGSIEYHEYNTEVRYALILVDRKWAWWTPYHTGLRTEEITSFELIDAGEDSFIHLCIEHFDKLWRHYDKDTAKNK